MQRERGEKGHEGEKKSKGWAERRRKGKGGRGGFLCEATEETNYKG